MIATEPVVYQIDQLLGQFGLSASCPDSSLAHYFDLLLAVNQQLNLVSRETTAPDLARLTAESLLPFTRVRPLGGAYLDIGSGGGFPAVPILLTLRLSRSVLLERTGKKARALARILEGVDLPAEVIPVNLEEFQTELRFNLVTLRYVSLTPQIFRAIDRLLTPNGLFVYYARPSDEILKLSTRPVTLVPFREQSESVTKYFTLFSSQTS